MRDDALHVTQPLLHEDAARSGRPPRELELAVLDGVQRRVLWLAAAIVHHANHVRPNRSGVKVGGHQASSASMVSLMTALWFACLEAPDRVSVKPHASPVLHAINYLLGRLEPRYLATLRQFGGLQSYPSRTKDPDPVDYSTGSVGIGATAPIWGALAHRYVAGHFDVPVGGRQIALIGDAELDEGACWEAIADPMVARLGEVMWVVDLNRQSLDRVVPDIAAGRLRVDVRGRRLALRDGQVRRRGWRAHAALRARIDAMPNEEYQRLLRADARRAAASGSRSIADDLERRRAARHVPRPRRPRPRRAARRLPRGRRGARPPERRLRLHDQGLAAADRGPSGQPLRAAHRRAVRASSRRALGADPDDPWAPFADGSAGGRAVRRARRGGSRAPSRRAAAPRRRACRADLGREHEGTRLDPAGVRALLRRPRRARRRRSPSAWSPSRPTSAPRPTSAAGSTRPGSGRSATASTGSPTTPTRSCAGARPTTAATSSSGIAEVNLVGLLGELGATWSRDGQPLLPVGTIYDPFVARALEPWSFGIYAGGQSILVGTPSGVTLGPEGGAHQSVITPSIGIEQPGCVAWEPAFGQDLEWAFLHALSRLGREDGEAAYFRLSTRPIDQALHTGTRAEVLRRRLPAARRPTRPRVVIAVMGALVPEAVEAADMLREEAGVEAEVVCITSADLLFRSFQARAGLGDGDPRDRSTRLFPHDAPVVALLDGHPHTLAFLRRPDRLPRRPALRPVGRPRRALRAPRDRRGVGRRRRAGPARGLISRRPLRRARRRRA